MQPTAQLLREIQEGNFKSLARSISLIENGTEQGNEILHALHQHKQIPVIGITGPPGAGKSSLVNTLIELLSAEGKRIGVIAVDPSSPFNFGALLGDRVRMSKHFNAENIFIRSMASRGSLGGLCEKIMEVTDVMKQAPFDFIFIETVGVGQSEVEIAGLADTAVVVLVPEAGDEVQTMKAGLMEIADVFVVNKADHKDADRMMKNLKTMLHEKGVDGRISVIKTIATESKGIDELLEAILNHQQHLQNSERHLQLLTEKAWRIIQSNKMKSIDQAKLKQAISKEIGAVDFNLYQFANKYLLQLQSANQS